MLSASVAFLSPREMPRSTGVVFGELSKCLRSAVEEWTGSVFDKPMLLGLFGRLVLIRSWASRLVDKSAFRCNSCSLVDRCKWALLLTCQQLLVVSLPRCVMHELVACLID